MQGLKDKKTIVLILYSVIVFIIFTVGLKYIINISNTSKELMASDSNAYYGINIDNTYNTMEDNTLDERLISDYNLALNGNFNIIIMLFFAFIVTSNFILLAILNRLEFKERMGILNNINNIEDEDEVLSIDPIMSKVYKDLKDKFDSHIEDYKRLNSYLSHEQKNAIAILRTSLELSGNEELLNTLNNVSNTVEDVLAISDTKNNEDMYEVDIALICAQVCDHYSKVYDNLSFDFDEDENMSIYGKEKWIYRGVSNLLDNAIKYGECKDICVNVKNQKGSVIVSVKDNGIGMNKYSMKKIFYDRYRINELNKDGYGIGLSLVKHVCNLCNGFVWVESEEGKGSTFYLVFKEYK
ncbi:MULTISPECIES: sensor histidine kinase [unclassified Clostridioides]|uniref:sensor histidine kinase n=1 Tax=unclassified Clostridioides TaxID=2635829 RepID=UPI001D10E5BD|nr:HAMP domain-containing histidine kinase [Clostridioides sp. ZZV14-6150]MCC0661573.1 HAMP domain-containing histidine kinase [Clostridioides sp. ZZV14-6154]MCC0668947.1 HAMP domain-containing histidine kinase [Clostridioides sp. ZZV14-6153]MCC0718238.1 HAMP domain-containing histidine kinase [Clostridioides sp. ZZV14-6105]MCC0721578.1 HAMP domain-containing histidine kinase [Clostridioides sp. ZZV14-6104]MCC0744842.1 HAMP domain-containing histidine kinase [Clostridioides sp. ZZV14-6044]